MMVIVGFLAHMGTSTAANICFKLSAGSRGARKFLVLQAAGHLTGFAGVLIFTYLLKYLPMGLTFPIMQGLSVLAVQVLAARYYFRESISTRKWIGTALIAVGVLLISIS